MDLITFSHFIPDQRLMPEKRFLMYPNLVRLCVEFEVGGWLICVWSPNSDGWIFIVLPFLNASSSDADEGSGV